MSSARVSSPTSAPACASPRASDARKAPFQDALGRAARGRAGAAADALRTLGAHCLENLAAPSDAFAATRMSSPARPEQAVRAEAPERVASAVESLSLRDRSSLELRFVGGLTVRVDALAPGVALAVERGPATPPIQLTSLAEAVRARGVPVVRSELRDARSGRRRGRSGAR